MCEHYTAYTFTARKNLSLHSCLSFFVFYVCGHGEQKTLDLQLAYFCSETVQTHVLSSNMERINVCR
jgi:hypothetical protein